MEESDRGRMTIDDLKRYKREIDATEAAKNAAWANETRWINARLDALKGKTP